MLRLFIDGHEAELDKSNSDIAITYQSTDTFDPTAIKNSFSKSIELKGTPVNNAVFGEVYGLDRDTVVGEDFYGTNFDSRKRVPFVLYRDSDICEKGYMQLDTIEIEGHVVSYSVSLYGTLGDFFYNLQSKTNEDDDDDAMTLADLTYGWADEEGIILQWDKDFILDGWEGLKDPNHSYTHPLAEWIKAVPTYSGLYDDFDNDVVMVNNVGLNGEATKYFPPVRVKSGSTETCITVENWSYITADRDLDEWECRDLRSQYQRPAIKLSTVLQAVSDPYNNGGYEVVWDEDILKSDYFSKSWLLLPRLDFSDSEENLITRYDFGFDTEGASPISTSAYTMDTEDYPYMYENGRVTVQEDGTLDHTLRLRVSGVTMGGRTPLTYNSLRICYEIAGTGSYTKYVWKDSTVMSGILVKQTVNTTVSYFFVYSGIPIPRTSDLYESFRQKIGNFFGIDYRLIELVESDMEYIDDSVAACYVNRSLKVNQGDTVKFSFRSCTVGGSDDGLNNIASRNLTLLDPRETSLTKISDRRVKTYDINNSDKVVSGIYTGEINPAVQPVNVTKAMLFDPESTPFDYLVWFTKSLNLRYRYDKAVKTIYIEPVYKYYLNEVVDITDEIDRGNSITITPNVAENKYYRYGFPTPETYASKIYDKKNKVDYGAIRKDTGYDFDRSVNDLFEDCVYKNGIPFSLSSILFNDVEVSLPTGIYKLPSPALLPKYKQTLWNGATGDEEEFDTLGYTGNINVQIPRKTDPLTPKICSFDDDNETVDDVTNILLFYEGEEDVRGKHFLLSDNIRMTKELLGSDSACHYYSESETYQSRYEGDMGKIKILRSIPVFGKCLTGNDGMYRSSWNFAKPDMSFVNDGGLYGSDCTLYDKYWSRYIADMFDKNAKKVECGVMLRELPDSALRKFYFFDNTYWILSKVEDYDPESEEPTTCEFTKIVDMDAYLQPIDDDYEELTTTTTAPDPVHYNVAPITFYNMSQSPATITLENYSGNTPNVEYSTDYRNWTAWDYSTINIGSNGTVWMRGSNPTGFNKGTSTAVTSYSMFQTTGDLKISGNLESLVDPENERKEGLANHYCFYRLFEGTSIVDAYDLDLHLTKLNGNQYYRNMLSAPTLVVAPKEMPATGLTDGCYQNMFINSSLLRVAPSILPATTLKPQCYQGMFYGTAIEVAPVLPAATLVTDCYRNMFSSCASLSSITAYFTTTPSDTYTRYWTNGVSATGNFYQSVAATWTNRGTNACPTGWTLTQVIPPTTTTTETTTNTNSASIQSQNAVTYTYVNGGYTVIDD